MSPELSKGGLIVAGFERRMVNLKWWWVGSGGWVARFGQRLWTQMRRERGREVILERGKNKKNEEKKKITVLQTVW